MTKTPRFWYLIAGIAVAGVLALGWFLGAAPLVAQASAADAQRAQVEQSNRQQEVVLASMKGQYQKLDELKAKMAELQLSVPGTADLDDFFNQLTARAQATGAVISAISASEAVAYGQTSAGSPSSSSSSSPGAGPSATPTPGATPTPTPTPAAPSAGAAEAPSSSLAGALYMIPITINLGSGTAQDTAFVTALQNGPRLMLVTTVAMTSSPAGGTVSGYIFVVHDPASGAAGALPSPTPSATATPTPTHKPAPTASTEPTPSSSPTPSGTPSR